MQNIRHLSLPQLTDWFVQQGYQKFRARQVWEWLWAKPVQSFAEMTNLSKELRQQLGTQFTLPALTIAETQHSADGTIKSRFTTWDGHAVEGV
ncbi:MAG TPA: 23S rRNA (adenine(2503)-C(2))-methyltransferase RlmN, partial [Phnomibacter sp.]|nr:23S rRNA (adenine(2503)-C(2))-methyltransferase RlmN [Phnomibacter sp.]